MAGGNGKGDKIILLHPEKTIIDKINDVMDEADPLPLKDERPIRFMGTFDEDPYIATLAVQYKAYMDRRAIRIQKRIEHYRDFLTFEDYLEVRGEL